MLTDEVDDVGDQHCAWEITCEKGYVAELQFTHFRLLEPEDYIVLSDGSNATRWAQRNEVDPAQTRRWGHTTFVSMSGGK